eukprot:359167-Chlamydomonas_euryale.AAC.1
MPTLCERAGVPWSGEPVSQPLSKEYHRLLKELLEREEATFGDDCPPFQLDLDDAVYITRELWRGFSARHMKRTLAPGGQKNEKGKDSVGKEGPSIEALSADCER